jgi:hypothetical protein
MTRKFEIKMSLDGGAHTHEGNTNLIYHAVFTLKKKEVDRMLKNARNYFDHQVGRDELLELIREQTKNRNAELPNNPVKMYPELVIALMLEKRFPQPNLSDISVWARDTKDDCKEFNVKTDETEMFAFSCRPV